VTYPKLFSNRYFAIKIDNSIKVYKSDVSLLEIKTFTPETNYTIKRFYLFDDYM